MPRLSILLSRPARRAPSKSSELYLIPGLNQITQYLKTSLKTMRTYHYPDLPQRLKLNSNGRRQERWKLSQNKDPTSKKKLAQCLPSCRTCMSPFKIAADTQLQLSTVLNGPSLVDGARVYQLATETPSSYSTFGGSTSHQLVLPCDICGGRTESTRRGLGTITR